jgi:hypothetical protein
VGLGGPVDQQQSGVVLQLSGLVLEHRCGEAAERLGCGQVRGRGVLGELDETLLAEELTVGVAARGPAGPGTGR